MSALAELIAEAPALTCGCPAYRGTDVVTTHECCVCGDAGFVRHDVPVDDPDFGRAWPCPGSRHHRDREAATVADEFAVRARIPQLYRGYNDRFTGWLPNPNREALQAAQGYVERWPPRSPFLLLLGSVGTGKTRLAITVQYEMWRRHGTISQFWPVPDLLERYRRSYGRDSEDRADRIDAELRACPLLVLDDLGAERQTEWADEQLYRLLNDRYATLKPTIVTSNRSREALDPRIGSRLADNTVGHLVVMTGPDRRIQP